MRGTVPWLALYLAIPVSALTAQSTQHPQLTPDFAIRFDHKGCHYEYLDTFKGTYSHVGAAHPVPITLTEQERRTLFDAIQAADFFNQPSDRGVGREPADNYELEVRNAGKRHTVRWTIDSSWYQSEAGRPLESLLKAIYQILEKQPAVLSLPARGDGCISGPPAVRSQSAPHIQDSVMTAIAAAAGMPPLENSVLPPGHREIRIRSEQPMLCCDPRPMLRLVEGDGEVGGSLWLFRTLVLRPTNPGPRDDERCEPLGTQHICVRPWPLSTASWAAVAARLEQLSAWTLTEPCNRPTIIQRDDGTISTSLGVVGDSGLLSVQRRIGSSLAAFLCIGPQYEREADGRKAKELYDYFVGMNGVIPPEPTQTAK